MNRLQRTRGDVDGGSSGCNRESAVYIRTWRQGNVTAGDTWNNSGLIDDKEIACREVAAWSLATDKIWLMTPAFGPNDKQIERRRRNVFTHTCDPSENREKEVNKISRSYVIW